MPTKPKRKVVKRRKPKPTMRSILRYIEARIPSMTVDEVQKLWAVLTALRGPDQSSWGLKRETTARIRSVAVPRLAEKCGRAQRNGDGRPIPFDILLLHNRGNSHFIRHIELAAEALGIPIKSDTDNPNAP